VIAVEQRRGKSSRPGVLEPVAGGWAERVAEWRGQSHAFLTVVGVIIASYVALSALLITSGLVVTHVVAHSRIGHWDEHVNSWFAAHRSSPLNRISADLTLMADTLGVAVVAAAVTVLLFARRWGHAALLLLIGLGIELSVFLSTTYLVARPRPHVPHLGSTPSTFSWPSGHSAATLVLYGGIAVIVMAATKRRPLRVLAWTVAFGLTLAVALSRIYRGEHHPIDTMGGVALGIGALVAAVFAIRTWSAVTSPAAVDQ
jgi:undecaprenyl-diphosphatase